MSDLSTELILAVQDRRAAQHYVSEFDQARTHWREFSDRLAEVDRIARGKFNVYGPDGKLIATEAPKTPNVVDLVLRDRAALAASVTPSLACPTPFGKDRQPAQLRERIAAGYLKANNFNEGLRTVYFRDLYKAGVNYKLVEPNYATGIPDIRRLDPRHVLPDRAYKPGDGDKPKNIMLTAKKPLGVLCRDYPEHAEELQAVAKTASRESHFGGHGLNDNDLVEVIEFYDASELVRVAIVPQAKGNRQGVELLRAPNLLKRLPIALAAQPTDDGIFQGIFEQGLGALEAENTIVNLLVDSAADWASSPVISWNIKNPQDHGKGILYAQDQTAFHRRTPPDQASAQIFGVMAGLRGNAREAMVFPQARAGDVQQSIASAAFVSSILGNYSTAVAQDQALEAASWQEVLELCFATDETCLSRTDDDKPWSKPVDLKMPDGETYQPARDIKGQYAIDVNYGFAAGVDEMNAEIRLYSAVQNRIISPQEARAMSVFVKDEVATENAIIQNDLLQAGLAFIGQQASIGNFHPAAALNDAIRNGEDVYLVLSQLADFQQAQPAPQGQQGTPTSAFEQAASMSRGGAGADTTNVAGVGAMPPLAQLLSG